MVARGKHMLFRIDGGVTLHTHYRMDGSWHLYRPGESWRGPGWQVRAVLETDEWVAVGFRLPVLELVSTEREQQVVGHLGPDPLGPDWDAEEALRRLSADPTRPVGEVENLPRTIELIRRLMEANRKTGDQITTGDLRPGRRRWVYGRAGEPCRRCWTPIAVRQAEPKDGEERVTYWCPSCQPGAPRPRPAAS